MKLSKKLLGITALTYTMALSGQVLADKTSTAPAKEVANKSSVSAAAVNHEEQQKKVEVFVKSAADYFKKNGKDKAIAEFNKKDGEFTKGESYIVVIDYSANVMAHPHMPEIVNKNQNDLQDVDGIYINREAIDKARKSGSGWIQYRIKNPETQVDTCKKTYVLPVDSTYLVLGGYFFASKPDGSCGP